MSLDQLFVGSTAIVLGVISVAAGASNREFFYQSRKIKWIETHGGRTFARALYAFIGVSLIGLGIAIALGFAPNVSHGSI